VRAKVAVATVAVFLAALLFLIVGGQEPPAPPSAGVAEPSQSQAAISSARRGRTAVTAAPVEPIRTPSREPGRVVARIDGRPIHEREAGIDPDAPIAFPPPEVNAETFERLRKEAIEPLVRIEVESAVLHREALRRGLERDPEYGERVAQLRQSHTTERREALAGLTEQKLLRGLTETVPVPARDVEGYIESARRNPDPFGQTKHLTAESVEEMLRYDKAVAAFQQRLLDMFLDSEIGLDDARIPRWRLEAAVRPYFPALARGEEPQPLAEFGFHRLLLEAMTRRTGVERSGLAGDVDRLATAFGATVLWIDGSPQPLGRTPCTRLFEPQPTGSEAGVRSVDLHGLSFCIYQLIRTELLVREAGRAGVSAPDEEYASWRLARLERQALIGVLLREEGVLDVPQEIPTRRRQLAARLEAEADIELLF